MNRVRMVLTALLLAAAQVGAPPVCRGAVNPPAAMPSVPYEGELYLLGYDVFLANENPLEAFLLAEKAVAERPDDIDWRRRAAQSGEWSGNSLRALEHWFYLADRTEVPEAADNALRLARGLSHNSLLKQLLEKRDLSADFALVLEYVAVCEALGEPEDAITELERHRSGPGKKQALTQLARLYEAVGQPQKAVDTWLELMSGHGMTAEGLLKAASLTYGTGDTGRAYAILSRGREQIPASSLDYWQNLSDLAWALQDMPAAEQASRLLVDSGKGREDDYQRLILLSRDKKPELAYQLSLDGWRRFGRIDYLKSVLELGLSLKRHKLLAQLLAEQEKTGRLKPQEQDAYYWSLVSRVQRGAGAVAESMRSYREALKRAPADGEMAAGYVWLLLDLERREELRVLLQSWKGREKKMAALYDPFAAAYAYLGQYQQALPFFQARYPYKRSSPDWLAAYADTLEQVGWQEAAFLERMQALHLARKQMKSASAASGEDRLLLIRDYARIAMLVQPGDAVDRLVREIMGGRQDDASRELVAAWALSSQRSDLSRLWFWREYARMTRRPRWVELTLALEDNDRPKIARLLHYDLERLPYRDAIEGAIRVGWTPLAETIAFESFQVNDRDYLLDQQVRELYGARTGGLRYHLSLLDQEGVGFLKQQLSLTSALTPRVSLSVAAGTTEIRHQESDVLGRYPSSTQSARIGLAMRHEGGSSEIFGGFRDALSLHAQAGLSSDWKLHHRRNLGLALVTGAEAEENVGLKIGGMKDEVSAVLLQGLTPRDSVLLRVSGRLLRDQDWNRLGQGASFEAELSHRLLFSGPDTTLRLFSGYHYYGRGAAPTGKALLLIPEQQRAAAADFYLPASFVQAGVGILVGQEGRDSYIRNWRPFGALDAYWNSSSTIGYRYELGLVGPIFGLDKMEGAFSQESGSFGRSEITSRLDLRYRYYFR